MFGVPGCYRLLGDKSFIVSWGGRVHLGGVGIFFCDVLGGSEIKKALEQGGSYILLGILGGSEFFHQSSFLKMSQLLGGFAPQTPHYS